MNYWAIELLKLIRFWCISFWIDLMEISIGLYLQFACTEKWKYGTDTETITLNISHTMSKCRTLNERYGYGPDMCELSYYTGRMVLVNNLRRRHYGNIVLYCMVDIGGVNATVVSGVSKYRGGEYYCWTDTISRAACNHYLRQHSGNHSRRRRGRWRDAPKTVILFRGNAIKRLGTRLQRYSGGGHAGLTLSNCGGTILRRYLWYRSVGNDVHIFG